MDDDPHQRSAVSSPHASPRSPVKWYRSIQARLLFVFFCFVLFLIAAVLLVIDQSASRRIYDNSKAYTIEKGHSVVNDLAKQIAYVEGISRSMAIYMQEMPLDAAAVQKIIPEFLENGDAQSLLAGGGVWPEPYQFDPHKARDSFFWGRDASGKLQFYDNYNDPGGKGYHQEEWYVPATFYPRGLSYWSQSYMDPYSLEPMVTCTTPYYRDGKLAGVVTIDVKLESLYAKFAAAGALLHGYLFAVDRNDRFLSYPQKSLAQVTEQDENSQTVSYTTLSEMSFRSDRFLEFERQMVDLENDEHAHSNDAQQLNNLRDTLARASYQIDDHYADILAHEILDRQAVHRTNFLGSFIVNDDPVLGEASFAAVYKVPLAHWKIVVVAPLAQLVMPKNEIINQLKFLLLTVMVLTLIAAAFVIQRILVAPVQRLTEQLAGSNNDADTQHVAIEHPAEDELGQLIYWFNRRTDSLIEARQQAERALRIKQDFMANISHEIRTPMNGILCAADILHDKDLDDETHHYTEIILRSSEALLKIINDILDYAKLEAGNMVLERESFDLIALLNDVYRLFKLTADKKQLEFSLLIHETTPHYLLGDEGRIRQVLLNVIGNAIKFTNHGSVKVSLRYDEFKQLLTIAVSDTGIGIEAEKLAIIFDNFIQADTSITRNYGGTGLGLSICNQLVELMDGTIRVNSTAGEGSEFIIELPLAITDEKPRNSAKTPSQAIETGVQFEGRVLIVEDNEVNQQLACRMVEQMGLTAVLVDDGQDAVAEVQRQTFDVILMDLQMPKLDGFSAAQIIRQMDEPVSSIPIIAMSASAGEEILVRCERAGMQGFITKPYRRSQLLSVMSRIFDTATV